MLIWAFSVVLHVGATFSLRENISNRISLNNVPPTHILVPLSQELFHEKILPPSVGNSISSIHTRKWNFSKMSVKVNSFIIR